MKHLSSLLCGVIFGVGLGLGGMLEPARVVGFLDFFGTWDPSLVLVMAGGLAFNAVAYRLTRKRERPFFLDHFDLPTRSQIDLRLIVGSVIFGIGWALAGYCPGPALTNLASGTVDSVLFLVAMGAGAVAAGFTASRTA